ncbi:MAG: TRAM domain-containing protein, partial [Spirochaetaceae bacterium]|nr:TRAM domain-containing protein [Spirochaetaceae bacterium]
LADMNRRYTGEHYLYLCKSLREKVPSCTISTDILVGFPGETEDDFNQTVSLMEKADFDYAFMYYYNPRENTRAFEMPNQLDEETKKSRLAKIVEIQRNRSLEKMRKKIGETQMVLVEGISKGNEAELIGRTEHDEHLVFPAPSSLVGKFVKVEINDLTGSTFRGKIVT